MKKRSRCLRYPPFWPPGPLALGRPACAIDPDGPVIEGGFNGSLHNVETLYADGSFRALKTRQVRRRSETQLANGQKIQERRNST